MSALFSSPSPAPTVITQAPAPIPPPSPSPPFQPVEAESSESAKEKERIKRRKGISSTILTGPQGLLPEQMPVTSPSLLAAEEN